jgi:preprotein translocase subunit Sss1
MPPKRAVAYKRDDEGRAEHQRRDENGPPVEGGLSAPRIAESPRTTQLDTQHERSYLMLTLALLSKCISERTRNLVLSTQTFFQDCKYFFKRCTFPDLEEFCRVMKRITCMLVILGALSYVIPLVFIVIKDILQT